MAPRLLPPAVADKSKAAWFPLRRLRRQAGGGFAISGPSPGSHRPHGDAHVPPARLTSKAVLTARPHSWQQGEQNIAARMW